MKGTVTEAPTGEDWHEQPLFLPDNWQELAAQIGAVRGLRYVKISRRKALRGRCLSIRIASVRERSQDPSSCQNPFDQAGFRMDV